MTTAESRDKVVVVEGSSSSDSDVQFDQASTANQKSTSEIPVDSSLSTKKSPEKSKKLKKKRKKKKLAQDAPLEVKDEPEIDPDYLNSSQMDTSFSSHNGEELVKTEDDSDTGGKSAQPEDSKKKKKKKKAKTVPKPAEVSAESSSLDESSDDYSDSDSYRDLESDEKPNGIIDLDAERIQVKQEAKKKADGKKKTPEWKIKYERDNIGRTKPNIAADREKERTLIRVATRGVVQLFNAVREHQAKIEANVNAAGKSDWKKDRAKGSLGARDFMDTLDSQKKKKRDRKEKTEVKEEDSGAEAPMDTSTTSNGTDKRWAALTDDGINGVATTESLIKKGRIRYDSDEEGKSKSKKSKLSKKERKEAASLQKTAKAQLRIQEDNSDSDF